MPNPDAAYLSRQTLSHYTIQEQIGAGGMGVVYRAIDTNLSRPVAIKVLPPQFANHPERRARFDREARLLATLDHRNIAAIYGMETSGDTSFLVLELVPGETLEDRLRRKPPDLSEVLGITRQITDALASAHERGVIHRDLKPANVKLTPAGVVKVLDFGLAKAIQTGLADPSDSGATVTIDSTAMGVIVGTAAYMSPEQARGGEVDQRTDIWAFGCLLYELLARRKAFPGKTVSDCIAAILTREADWSALPPDLPRSIMVLLRRCLQKDPQRRLRDIGDARLEIEDALAAPADASSPEAPPRVSRLRVAVLAAACLLIGTLATAIAAKAIWKPVPGSRQVVRFQIPLAPNEAIRPSNSVFLAMSPDGSRVAYTPVNPSGPVIYLRDMDQQQPRAIPDIAGTLPTFSPDGEWLAFFQPAAKAFRRMALSGGAPITICDSDFAAGMTWGEDGNLVFGSFGLFTVPITGGTPKTLLKVDVAKGERFYRLPQYLPGARGILFTIGMADTETFDDGRIAVLDLKTGQKKILIEGGSCPRYSPSGHLLYARAGKLLAVPFDVGRLAVTGQPMPVLDGVFMSRTTGMAAYSISNRGDLAYAPGPVEGGHRLPIWVDRQGHATAFNLPQRCYLHPRLSPDDKQLAVEIEGTTHDVFDYDLARGVLTRLSMDGASHWPLWTPKGDRITFRSWKTGGMTMWWMPADRSGPEEMLPGEGRSMSPESWSPDGKVIAYTRMDFVTNFEVWLASIAGDRKARPLLTNKFSEASPKFSPDGKWLAYCSNESGRPEAYVVQVADRQARAKIQVSTDGGTDPMWRRKGGEIFYRNGDKMMAVSVSEGATLTLSKPRELWTRHFMQGSAASCGMPGVASANYDVTADGERFVMIEDKDQDAVAKQINVVLNFGDELKRGTRPARF